MDLNAVEKEAIKIRNNAEYLANNYAEIVSYLNNMYNITLKYNMTLSNTIMELIKKYNSMIKEISSIYLNSSNKILKYVDNSNKNLEELLANVSTNARSFEELQASLDTIETL